VAKTRGSFALITKGKTLLLSERMDGKGWNLPGGRVEEGETDQVALVREIEEETGLKVEVLHKVGPDHVFGDDTAIAYSCKVVGGGLKITAEAKNHAWVTAQEVRQRNIFIPGLEFGMYAPQNDVNVPLKLVGPEGRLGRTGRMVWDAFSLMEEPKRDRLPFDKPEFFVLGTTGDNIPSDFQIGETRAIGTNFFQRLDEHTFEYWPRLDPYSPTDQMQTKQ